MPYLITTKSYHAPDSHDAYSRRAVATLDEAREAATATIVDGPNRYGTDAQIIESYILHEQGGTIGPLPDGTVIEVKQVTDDWLMNRLAEQGLGWAHRRDSGGIIDAYNAAQED